MAQGNHALAHIDIEVNHRCNLACRHCSARVARSKHPDELSAEEIRQIIKTGHALGLRKVGLTGGEPLMDVSKTEAVGRFCVIDLGIPVHTHTNGTLVTAALCKPGAVLSLFESVSVTFLGGDAETHERMTQTKGSFEKSFEGARLIAAAGLPLTCYFIPTHGTCSGFLRLAEKLQAVGVNRIRAMALAPSGRARSIYGEAAPLQGEMQRFEKDLLEVSSRLGVHVEAGYCTRLSMPGLAVLAGHDQCMSGINRVHINSKGDVFPCTAASGVKELALGNLRKNNLRLDEIWANSELVNQIRLVHQGQVPACANCPRDPKCRDACTVNACGTMPEEERKGCPLVNGTSASAATGGKQ